MTYKKLFPIKYNSKRFMIFIDENNRRTFLEINNKEEYEYPTLEDFVALNKIFNEKDPFICYMVPKFKFKECVKTIKNGALSLLTVITIINSMPTALGATTNVEVQDDRSISVSISSPKKEKQEIIIEDLDDLNKYLGQLNVTKEMVYEVVDHNNNMPNKYKRIAKDIVEEMTSLYPNINLRIFYENIKDLTVYEYNVEEFRKAFPEAPGGAAFYDAKLNAIVTIDYMDIETLCHELYHAFHNLYFELEDKVIIRYDENTGLNESLVDIGSGQVTPSKYGYPFSKRVTNYLLTLVDYTIEDYNEKGTKDLINKLKAKYPNVDIGYINETLNTYNQNSVYLNQAVSIDDLEYFRDELFKICLQEASLNKGYEPFNNFARIFFNANDPKLVFNYFDEYNTKLKELGHLNIISKEDILGKFELYSNINGIGTSNNEIYPIARGQGPHYLRLYPDGSSKEIIISSGCESKRILSEISSTIFSDYEIFGTNDYWFKLNEDFGFISPHKFESIPIYINGNLLITAMPKDLTIQLGFDNDNLGFIIYNSEGEVIYKTCDKLTNLSNQVLFSDYIQLLPSYITAINLEDVLNIRHVNNFQRMYPNDKFENLKQEENENNLDTSDNKIPITDNKPIIENNSFSEIYINNEVIAKTNVNNLYLAIGKTKDGKIGYVLTNKAGMPIYESAEVIEELSNPINFEEYTGPGFSKMYLEDYLNEDYLRNFQKETGKFNNLELIGDKIVIDNSVKIIIQSKLNERVINSTYKLSKLKIYIKNGIVTVSSLTNMPDIDSYDLVIDVEDILKYCNMLDEGVSPIRLTKDDLMEMTEKYINDLNSNLDKGSIIR